MFFRSLKAKFTLAFGLLILAIFACLGFFLIDSKEKELLSDIAQDVQSFSRFSTEELVLSYENELEQGNFIAFQSDVSAVLRQSVELNAFQLFGYSGSLLFDSVREQNERYEGAERGVSDDALLERLQSPNLSLRLDDGRVLYVKRNVDQELSYVNSQEQAVEPLGEKDRILDVVVPYGQSYALRFPVDYTQLNERLLYARNQIIAVALLGLALTLILSYMLSVSVTRPLRDLKHGAIKLSSGDFKTRVPVRTKDELGLLAETFNKMAKDLAKSTKAKIYQERVQKELELASQIQTELLPQEKLVLKKSDIAGGLISATEVGGDAFDYMEMKDGRYLVYIADVTGHGVPAGIISSVANAQLYSMRDQKDPLKILDTLNDVLVKKTLKKLFMTLSLMLWDEKKAEVIYVNAGHPPMLHYDHKTKKVKEVKQSGIAVGLVDSVKGKLKSTKIKLKKNDVLVLYSDGVPEAENKKKEAYGMERLKHITEEAGKDLYTAEAIKNAILSDATEFLGKRERQDDMTVLVLKRK